MTLNKGHPREKIYGEKNERQIIPIKMTIVFEADV